ncbi:MAG TPA: class I SAM-dependent methyltransferase [Fimbriimonas sp.]|nr:class I SAM-dependent methyltransferase [Fimbriimonas sp.]
MTAAYDEIAEWYDESVRQRALLASDDLLESNLFQVLGDLRGLTVCDLACGQGHLSRRLARGGAKVVGVDISIKLLEIARREEASEPCGIEYVHGDAEDLQKLGVGLFDGVLCNLALMDIDDLAATFQGVAGILRSGGWFVATITHPCYSIPENRRYFHEGFWRSDFAGGVRGQVGARHRTLGTYLSALGEAGLLVRKAVEPEFPNRETPPILILQCRHVGT